MFRLPPNMHAASRFSSHEDSGFLLHFDSYYYENTGRGEKQAALALAAASFTPVLETAPF